MATQRVEDDRHGIEAVAMVHERQLEPGQPARFGLVGKRRFASAPLDSAAANFP